MRVNQNFPLKSDLFNKKVTNQKLNLPILDRITNIGIKRITISKESSTNNPNSSGFSFNFYSLSNIKSSNTLKLGGTQ